MKKSLMLLLFGLCATGIAPAAPSTKEVSQYPLGERSIYSERATVERIRAVGSACVEGQPCAGVAAPAPVASAASGGAARSGEAVYNASCAACHGTGAAGAPKHGDKAAWGPRLAKGKATLYQHALQGFNAMPPKGMCSTCSDEEIKAAVDYVSR